MKPARSMGKRRLTRKSIFSVRQGVRAAARLIHNRPGATCCENARHGSITSQQQGGRIKAIVGKSRVATVWGCKFATFCLSERERRLISWGQLRRALEGNQS